MVLLAGVACIFAALFVAFAAIGGLTSETPGVNRSIAVLEALTNAPEQMRNELDLPFADRVLAPLLGARARPQPPAHPEPTPATGSGRSSSWPATRPG